MKNLLILTILLFSFTLSAQKTGETNVAPKCTALTQKGIQCKNAGNQTDGKCSIHSDTTPRCGQPTKSGGKCKIQVKVVGDKCHWHKS